MDFRLDHEQRAIKALAERFVREHLLPLEPAVLARVASGQGAALPPDELARVDSASREVGLWGLDAPEEWGGANLPMVTTVGVEEALGGTVVPYRLPPDSPNLRLLMATASASQRERYLEPYARGELTSAMAISEPGAGADPAAMTTRARRVVGPDGSPQWRLDGRKIWITRAAESDFTIVMAVTDPARGARGGMSAFIVERGTPGFHVLRPIPMIGGHVTYEIALEDCRVPASALLGEEGQGFAPMQLRLSTRRIQIAARAIGAAERALRALCDYAPQRSTFGAPLAERQTVQWWVADAATRIHAARLMTYEAADRVDRGEDAREQIAMIKVFASEVAGEVVDHAIQAHGAMGLTRELPLAQLADEVRMMRIYEGPNEVHRWTIARRRLGLKR